jgi:soluble P-type ATPase
MNARSGIAISIPGFGDHKVKILVTDYTGTLACGGRLASGVRERLLNVRDLLDPHVITADSFGTADAELSGIVTPYRLREARHDVEKEQYVKGFDDTEHMVAFGNGNNDRLMLRAVKNGGGIAVAIANGKGCSLDPPAPGSRVRRAPLPARGVGD